MTDPVLDQSEAWPRLEGAVGEVVAALPEFPGFETRTIHEFDCDDPSLVEYELSYGFSLADSETDAVREGFVRTLRRHLPAIGYEISAERFDAEGRPRGLEAVRTSDGVNVWYRVLGLVTVKAQSGRVRRVDGFEPYCPRPIGGVDLDRDAAADFCERGYTDEAADSDSTSNVDPYEL